MCDILYPSPSPTSILLFTAGAILPHVLTCANILHVFGTYSYRMLKIIGTNSEATVALLLNFSHDEALGRSF